MFLFNTLPRWPPRRPPDRPQVRKNKQSVQLRTMPVQLRTTARTIPYNSGRLPVQFRTTTRTIPNNSIIDGSATSAPKCQCQMALCNRISNGFGFRVLASRKTNPKGKSPLTKKQTFLCSSSSLFRLSFSCWFSSLSRKQKRS